MAIYRAEGSRRLALVGSLALVTGLAAGVVVGRLTAPDLAAQLGELRIAAAPIGSALEVVRVEYPKLLSEGADPGGAEGALARIRTTFGQLQPALALLDRDATTGLDQAIQRLAGLIATRAAAAEVREAADEIDATLAAILGSAP